MSFGIRRSSRLRATLVRFFVVVSAGFVLSVAVESRGARLDASGRWGDAETMSRRAEMRLLDLPLLWNPEPADAPARVRAALARLDAAVAEGVAAGLDVPSAVAAIGAYPSEVVDTETPPLRRSAILAARRRLYDSGRDFETVMRHGALAASVLDAARAPKETREHEALLARFDAAFRARGTFLGDAPPRPDARALLVKAVEEAASSDRLASVAPQDASKTPYVLRELSDVVARLDDASAARLIRALEAWTALPRSGISSDDPASRAALRASFERTMRRRGFALVPATPSVFAHVTETRFFRFLADLAAFDLGESTVIASSTPVIVIVSERLRTTLALCGSALVAAFCFGVVAGFRASRRTSPPGVVSIAAASLPEAWIGTALLFATASIGAGGPLIEGIAACACLAVPATIPVARLVEARLRAVRGSAFADASRLLGASESAIDRRHALPRLRNDLAALLVVASPSVVGGAVVVETLFGFRGMGALLAEAALSGDGPVVLGVVLFVGLATVTAHALFVPDAAEVAP